MPGRVVLGTTFGSFYFPLDIHPVTTKDLLEYICELMGDQHHYTNVNRVLLLIILLIRTVNACCWCAAAVSSSSCGLSLSLLLGEIRAPTKNIITLLSKQIKSKHSAVTSRFLRSCYVLLLHEYYH